MINTDKNVVGKSKNYGVGTDGTMDSLWQGQGADEDGADHHASPEEQKLRESIFPVLLLSSSTHSPEPYFYEIEHFKESEQVLARK